MTAGERGGAPRPNFCPGGKSVQENLSKVDAQRPIWCRRRPTSQSCGLKISPVTEQLRADLLGRQPRMRLAEAFQAFENRCLGQFLALQLRRHLPAWIDSFHVGQFVRDALVAVDAGCLSREQVTVVDFGCARGLSRQVHCDRGVVIAAFQAVIGLEARPLVLGQSCHRRTSRRAGSDLLPAVRELPCSSDPHRHSQPLCFAGS